MPGARSSALTRKPVQKTSETKGRAHKPSLFLCLLRLRRTVKPAYLTTIGLPPLAPDIVRPWTLLNPPANRS